MTKRYQCLALALLLLFLLPLSPLNDAIAEEGPATPEIVEPQQFTTEHKARFNGQNMTYIATAGETYLRDLAGEPTASIFTFAYVKKAPTIEVRPVTFIWNGGPGSPSLWLHMGSLGPRRVVVPSDAGNPGSPPYPIKDAPETLLDVTDLVFVDPVGTGFSRPLGDHKGKEFWGLTEDAESMAKFIHTWLTENNRWNSPRFILGESFGTTRAAAVARILQEDLSVPLNGLIFISQALDYQGSSPYVRDNLISHITYLPTMAATAYYHGKVEPVPADFKAFIEASQRFATDELLPALFKGNRLDAATRLQVAERLAYFTGLDLDYILRANLRVQGFRFAKALKQDKGLTVGLLDSRYVTDEVDDLAPDPGTDASNMISGAYNDAMRHYLRNDLAVTWQRQYLMPADPDLSSQWRWQPVPADTSWEPRYVNTTHDLSQALRANTGLRVMVASGYYDLVTPFFDAEYTLNRHDIPADRIDYHYYQGGHMMYLNDVARQRLLQDMRAFMLAQLASK